MGQQPFMDLYRIFIEVFQYVLNSLETFLDPCPSEGPIKSPLSGCLFVRLSIRQFGVFLGNDPIVFSDF